MDHSATSKPPKIVPVSPKPPSSSSSQAPGVLPVFITTQQLYDAVFENAFHAMYIGNAREKIIRFNDRFSRLFGFSPGEIKKMKTHDLYETSEKAFISFLSRRKQKGIASGEVTCIRKSGERFPCRLSSVIYEADNGEKRSMNTLVDISKNIADRWRSFG